MKLNKWHFIMVTALLITGCKHSSPVETTGESQSVEAEQTLSGSESGEEASTRAQENESSKSGENLTDIDGSLEELAKSYTASLLEGDFEALKTGYQYDEQLKALVEDGSLEQAIRPSLLLFGDLKEMGNPFSTVQGKSRIVSVPCQMTGQSVNINLVFNVDNQISGVNFGAYDAGTVKTMPDSVKEQELNLTIEDGKELPGILTLPAEEGTYPVIVLVHGSGPNDKDETLGYNTVFKDLAWGLAQKGIGTYRYDKRTLVYPEDAADIEFTAEDETVRDAVAAAELMKHQEGIDDSRIYVLGHSLGGFLMPEIAAVTENGAGYILLAAPARSMSQLLPEQYEFLANLDGVVTDQERKEIDQVKEAAEKIKHPDELEKNQAVLGAYPAYWKSLENYDCIETARQITKPVLVLQGEEDYQVTMEDFEIWKQEFGNYQNWEFQSFPGLTHLMMKGEKKLGPASYQKMQTVDEQVIERISDFVKAR